MTADEPIRPQRSELSVPQDVANGERRGGDLRGQSSHAYTASYGGPGTHRRPPVFGIRIPNGQTTDPYSELTGWESVRNVYATRRTSSSLARAARACRASTAGKRDGPKDRECDDGGGRRQRWDASRRARAEKRWQEPGFPASLPNSASGDHPVAEQALRGLRVPGRSRAERAPAAAPSTSRVRLRGDFARAIVARVSSPNSRASFSIITRSIQAQVALFGPWHPRVRPAGTDRHRFSAVSRRALQSPPR